MNAPADPAALEEARLQPDTRRFADWRRALKTILAFWIVYMLTVVLRALLGTDPLTTLENKLVTFGAGIVLTACIYAAVQWFAPRPALRRKAVVAGIGSVLASAALTATLMAAENHMRSSQEEFRFKAREGFVVVQRGQQIRIEHSAADPLVLTMPSVAELHQSEKFRLAADTVVVWLFFFAAWSAIYLALVSQSQALALQRRAAVAESAAQVAQVRALRYQINPHFLFNTLNSLSSLVLSGRPAEAESMILKLSTFLRNSLSLDPTADVTLKEEIELQRLYLDIEKVRFPRRLKVEFDVPTALENCRLPALILQPLVENAIKYGVSATRDRVTLRIEASQLPGERLQIEVRNSGGTALKAPRAHDRTEGMGVGLVNVAERLHARFGSDATCFSCPLPDGYQVMMTMPVTHEER